MRTITLGRREPQERASGNSQPSGPLRARHPRAKPLVWRDVAALSLCNGPDCRVVSYRLQWRFTIEFDRSCYGRNEHSVRGKQW